MSEYEPDFEIPDYLPEEEQGYDDAIDAEISEREIDIESLIPLGSELRKPPKEMNPALAVEEACKLPPDPIMGKNVAENGRIYSSIVDGKLVWNHTGDKKMVMVRCPVCVRTSGKFIVKGNSFPCRCCGGFVYVSEVSIIGYVASLNEISEEMRIDAKMVEIVKEKKVKRKTKLEKEAEAREAEAKRSETLFELPTKNTRRK